MHHNTSPRRFDFKDSLDESAQRQAAKIELTRLLGKEGFYNWSSSLPRHIVLSDRLHTQAILEKIEELKGKANAA